MCCRKWRLGLLQVIDIPAGCVVREITGADSVPMAQREVRFLADLVDPEQRVLLAKVWEIYMNLWWG